jgi:excisionase family DNA binding protein
MADHLLLLTGDGFVDLIQANITGRKGNPLPPDVAITYRVNDAAKVAGLSRSKIYELIGEGKLRSVMVAGRRLIPADALRGLLLGAA